MPRAKPFGHWTTAETVRNLLIHTKSGAILEKYGLSSVETTARAVLERLAAGMIRADFRPSGLGLFGVEVGFWDLDCSVAVFDRGFLDSCDDAKALMALPDGTVERMPLPADLLLWGASVLAAFEYDQSADESVDAERTTADAKTTEPSDALEPVSRTRRGNSYRYADLPLAREMAAMIRSGEAKGPNDAALALCERASGRGTADSKRKRLLLVYASLNEAEIRND